MFNFQHTVRNVVKQPYFHNQGFQIRIKYLSTLLWQYGCECSVMDGMA